MKNKVIIALFSAAIAMTGCKDSFFDINENPNNPTEPTVKASYLLPMVLKQTATRMGTQYSWAASWSGYWGRGSDFGPSLPLENYDITPSYQQAQWANSTTSWYDVLTDADFMEKKGKATNEEFYVGVAKVMKSIGFMYLVDMYNNVPYSDALRGDAAVAPKYDKGEDIYKDLLVQLDSARLIFKKGLAISDEIRSADVLFGGDLTKWRKLANTQALKLLIHQSEFNKNPGAEIAKITGDGSGFIESDKSANLTIAFAMAANQVNPVYSTYVANQNGTLADGFNRVSNYLLNRYKNTNDIRYQYLFLPARNPVDPNNRWVGKDLGATNVKGASSSQESIVIGTGILKDGTQPLWLMTSVESLFLQAEAIQRGWITGDAKTAYENAVKESFKWLKVTDASTVSTAFLLSPSANWATATNKLELIINQKYLSLPGINNFEAYVDYRRLGFPKDVPLSKNTSVGTRKIPLRLMYPQNEYSFNNANVKAQGDIDPQKSTIFWDVN
ncbi:MULTISPECIES: SusD/RagB family nutrient-binding outer membrane lipoprotein [unclassified Sphingobacterium]|uniref:SusD/RagB family nutrient-binding outer membrane lipoprotein n=1 Tax=unclassified Sphingobacterium TaxID=2609468 RepID=UPI002952C3FC|nr:SusD/RagB family nutrient-binding outer membrane lipoprotein [Sphingobacterium sp. UGAL515B_05]WON95234.1 SusD/RagB family nutrient-binding outer membrane lipoprotein [Sphingobacterium sp. UGAL515B_05]